MIDETSQPLVSCIMPTYNRREFVPLAIRYFLRQDYANKELIIIDDGTVMQSKTWCPTMNESVSSV